MPHLFFGKPVGKYIELDEHETQHLKVVRLKIDEPLLITDGEGNLYKCKLTQIGKDRSSALITESNKIEEKDIGLVVCVASQNWDRLRLLVEKSVELGVDKIIIYKSRRSKSYLCKEEKIRLIIRDSAKQCFRCLFPDLELYEDLSFVKHQNKVIVLHQSGRLAKIDDFKANVTIIVGPEGDFEKTELDLLRQSGELLSLGRKILRFETAAILTVGMASFLNRKI
ncbi:MAG TPA: 16S rRNA (uracil(1498)-N(3))-methyltransferase [Pseudothermotoga sp.]|nr:16S rRNA (uracil(1498)-N(3))-methyltransferase [Pseudothermotoga sp.]HOK83360.1 16S rRNA (uracil(1498)-N(3))-methyltransferase [Pseudothermotoga sp.]HPP70185.1 16S rRNA (uracil(1498)-N(3))-methyltransferase [Pseudothermotoga sp.]